MTMTRPAPVPRRRLAVLLLPPAVACLLLGAACGPQPGSGPAARAVAGEDDEVVSWRGQAPELLLDFEGVVVPGDTVPTVRNDGRARVDLRVVTVDGGRLTWAEGRGNGVAVRTPAYAGTPPAPGATIVGRPRGETDLLSPGRRPFRIEIDVKADPAERGREGDNGDNLLQRGRYGKGLAQYKLQLDHGVPACRVAGTKGVAELEAPDPVEPGRWYRLTCTRTAGSVRLVVVDLEGGSVATAEEAVAVDVGSVVLGDVPLSVGAKVGDDGRLDPSDLDQFHGVIDRVVVDVS